MMLLQRNENCFDAISINLLNPLDGDMFFVMQEDDDGPPMSHEVTITTQQESEEEEMQTMKQEPLYEEDDSRNSGSSNNSVKDKISINLNNNNNNISEGDYEDSDDEPGDLTSLSWLQNITNIMAVPALPTPPDSPNPSHAARAATQPERTTRSMKLHQSVTRCHEEFKRNQQLYLARENVKPPFSYATMICMAMRENGNKMTLSEIYAWIKDNFVYYRKADPSWQNSIRHNLSLNKVFVKVARSKDERGKGGFWKMDPDRLQERRRFKKRAITDKERTEQIPQKAQRKKPKVEIQLDNIANSPQMNEDIFILEDLSANLESQISLPMLPQLTAMDAEDSLPLLPLDSLLACTTDQHDGAAVEVQSVHQGMQVGLAEDELAGLLLSGGWDDSQLELLDSLLDSL